MSLEMHRGSEPYPTGSQVSFVTDFLANYIRCIDENVMCWCEWLVLLPPTFMTRTVLSLFFDRR